MANDLKIVTENGLHIFCHFNHDRLLKESCIVKAANKQSKWFLHITGTMPNILNVILKVLK